MSADRHTLLVNTNFYARSLYLRTWSLSEGQIIRTTLCEGRQCSALAPCPQQMPYCLPNTGRGGESWQQIILHPSLPCEHTLGRANPFTGDLLSTITAWNGPFLQKSKWHTDMGKYENVSFKLFKNVSFKLFTTQLVLFYLRSGPFLYKRFVCQEIFLKSNIRTRPIRIAMKC